MTDIRLEKPSKELLDFVRDEMAKHNINIVTVRQQPRPQTVWKPRTRSLRLEYEEGMRKLDPSWQPPKEDMLIIDYITLVP